MYIGAVKIGCTTDILKFVDILKCLLRTIEVYLLHQKNRDIFDERIGLVHGICFQFSHPKILFPLHPFPLLLILIVRFLIKVSTSTSISASRKIAASSSFNLHPYAERSLLTDNLHNNNYNGTALLLFTASSNFAVSEISSFQPTAMSTTKLTTQLVPLPTTRGSPETSYNGRFLNPVLIICLGLHTINRSSTLFKMQIINLI